MVCGDIAPILYTKFLSKLAVPITRIFNVITRERKWPDKWKKEYVTVIPKEANSQDPGECRNVSCTNELPKVYESFVLEWCRQEVKPKLNQFSGEPGAEQI